MKEVDKSLLDELARQEAVTIGFSCGKDSLVCTSICLELGLKVFPFYFYHVPDMQFVNDQIKRYEDLLKIEVIQLPHPMLYDTIRWQDWQDYRMAVYLNGFDWPHLGFEELIRAYFDDAGNEFGEDYYDVVGMRAAESFNRRKVFEKKGPIYTVAGQRKIFPIWNWKKGDVFEYLKAKNIPLTRDYEIWNRSWDGLKYQFLFGVKDHYPEDYKTITEYFALIETETLRYEYNRRHMGKAQGKETTESKGVEDFKASGGTES